MCEALHKLPAEVNAAETVTSILNMVEWLQVQRDRREARRDQPSAEDRRHALIQRARKFAGGMGR